MLKSSFSRFLSTNYLCCLGYFLFYLFFPSYIFSDFVHHSDVVRAMKKRFSEISTYQAKFTIKVINNNKSTTSTGTVYYKKSGKVNFSFANPNGDKIISNGKKMWIYIRKLNAVGVQALDKENSNIYNSASYEGLVRLFRRYHYRFDSIEQPKEISGNNYYVLALDEKVDSGGFSSITIYVQTNTKLIKKLVAISRGGRKVELEFRDIKLNVELLSSLFTYKVEGNVKIVENPLSVN